MVRPGQAHFNTALEDVAYITVYFPNNIIAHINVNWLSPVKVRTTLIGGQKKMLVWNDLDPDEKIKIYDKGVEVKTKKGCTTCWSATARETCGRRRWSRRKRSSSMAEHFVDCVDNGKTSINDGLSGLRVVKMLEAADKSSEEKGRDGYL